MKKIVLIVAPHPDDETLGCGGTICRLINEGHSVHWLIATDMRSSVDFTDQQISVRQAEIKKVANLYGFSSINQFKHSPSTLNEIPKKILISDFVDVLENIRPTDIYIPYRNDAHDDHQAVFDGIMSAAKSFRRLYIQRIYSYEVVSETDFGLKPEDGGFRPNVFVDISNFLEKKLEILEQFESEISDFPFPRSRLVVESLARLRGSQCNSKAAESYMLIKEIY
jgi:N-acetylglucosamine malate deacetylase 1